MFVPMLSSCTFQTGVFDLIFSSLAIQWVFKRRKNLFARLYRVTKPGGTCFFTLLEEGSMQKLVSLVRVR